MQTSGDLWLTRQEVADRLKVPVKTVANWAQKNSGPRYATIGRFCRYRLSDVEAWEATRYGPNSPAA